MIGWARLLKGYAEEGVSLVLSARTRRIRHVIAMVGEGILLGVASLSLLAIFFIVWFIVREALPFFRAQGIHEFFTSRNWYPSAPDPEFGALAIFVGSALVTLGAVVVAVPFGVAAAVCLSDVMPFALRQIAKPILEVLAAIPSVAYGFFALVVFAPFLQEHGGRMLAVAAWAIGIPLVGLGIGSVVTADVVADRLPERVRRPVRWGLGLALAGGGLVGLVYAGQALSGVRVESGTNALNVSIILGIMALPTVVSVSEDALQAVGRELREASYALGATRAETLLRTVLPAASSGILAAVILGVMRAIGETMVVWMASGNAAQIPQPWYNLLQPVRTLTATIAGDMGEADHMTGSDRYHVLWVMALCLLVVSLLCNGLSEGILRRARRKIGT